MRRTLASVVTLGLFVALLGAVSAQDKPVKPIAVSDKTTIKATVEGVDTANRTITIKGKKGTLMTVPVDESVQRFDQIKVGDKITATYYESVVYEVKKPGEATPDNGVSAAAAALPGAKPSGAAMTQTTMTVIVEAIDRITPAVTIKTADGESISMRVAKKKNLDHVNVGDKVVITRTEALVVGVEGPTK